MENRRLKERRPSVAQLERDAALQRVSTTRRWVIGGAAALSAGIAALVSAIAPGHSLGAKSAEAATVPSGTGSGQATARASTTSKKMPPLAKPSDLGLAGPAAGPTAPSNTDGGGSGNTGPAPAGNSGNAGSAGNTGATGGGGTTGNTGGGGNTGAVVAPSATPPPPTVSSGGS